MSIFTTASGGIFAYGIKEMHDDKGSILLVLFANFIYWLGFLLYNRYRLVNKNVSTYLVELEKEMSIKFQTSFGNFHKSKISTPYILIGAGIIYSVYTIAIVII